ncbi:hypothetical protein [Mycoplasmopsis felis]|uniref:hypothetical protein n=1 Tax=Mycoplasmopsis felis TaxID=33923 RepID=UPI002AFDE245|nr:hypothetical protein [Mycoplasmopsis felis]WQQ09825.1 hypothetical protein RRG49_02485 [Mycoplasmopsis felis]
MKLLTWIKYSLIPISTSILPISISCGFNKKYEEEVSQNNEAVTEYFSINPLLIGIDEELTNKLKENFPTYLNKKILSTNIRYSGNRDTHIIKSSDNELKKYIYITFDKEYRDRQGNKHINKWETFEFIKKNFEIDYLDKEQGFAYLSSEKSIEILKYHFWKFDYLLNFTDAFFVKKPENYSNFLKNELKELENNEIDLVNIDKEQNQENIIFNEVTKENASIYFDELNITKLDFKNNKYFYYSNSYFKDIEKKYKFGTNDIVTHKIFKRLDNEDLYFEFHQDIEHICDIHSNPDKNKSYPFKNGFLFKISNKILEKNKNIYIDFHQNLIKNEKQICLSNAE